MTQKNKTITIQKTMVQILKEIFKNRVGMANGLTKTEILRKVYGSTFDELNQEQKWYKYTRFVLPALHRMRKKSKYFVISADLDKQKIFFVVSNRTEYQIFETKVHKEEKGLAETLKRCERAVKEKWFEQLD